MEEGGSGRGGEGGSGRGGEGFAHMQISLVGSKWPSDKCSKWSFILGFTQYVAKAYQPLVCYHVSSKVWSCLGCRVVNLCLFLWGCVVSPMDGSPLRTIKGPTKYHNLLRPTSLRRLGPLGGAGTSAKRRRFGEHPSQPPWLVRDVRW